MQIEVCVGGYEVGQSALQKTPESHKPDLDEAIFNQ